MTSFRDMVTDVKQGYSVIDLYPEESEEVWSQVQSDVKQGYTVIDILEEEDPSFITPSNGDHCLFEFLSDPSPRRATIGVSCN